MPGTLGPIPTSHNAGNTSNAAAPGGAGHVRSMTSAEIIERSWLAWLVKVRIIIITLLFGIGLFFVRFTSRTNVDQKLFFAVILLWYTVAVFYVLLHRLWDDAAIQARLQIITDVAFSSALIYVTGGIDTAFNLIYLLFIIIASILLPRWWTYLTAALSFISYGAILELSYYEVVRSYSVSRPDLNSLQVTIFTNFVGYVAIAYLSSNLSQKLRQAGVELQEQGGTLRTLRVQHENIIHSMRGGLITTGLDRRVTLLNAAGQKLLERSTRDVYGRSVDELFEGPLPNPQSASVTGEVRSRSPSGKQKTLGITESPLSDGTGTAMGYVYAFDDLTEMRRLEREVRMRDRLSAV